MKIKSSFVTNSSSTSYIIFDTNNPPLNLPITFGNLCAGGNPYAYGFFEIKEYRTFRPSEVEELKYYNNNCQEPDWVTDIMGSKYNRLGSNEAYLNSLKALNEGKTVHYITVNNNLDVETLAELAKNLKIIYCFYS